MASRFAAVIMAGGAGTRFWPRSRRRDPKQTLPFLGGASLLQRTVARLRPLVEPADILIVTGRDQLDQAREQLPELPAASFLAEPCGRNTAPCVALAAAVLTRRGPADRPMVVLPADHFIGDEARWLAAMAAGAERAALVRGRTVVFGITPTEPHTGFGYVAFGPAAGSVGSTPVHAVEGFREKPDRPTAEEYLASGSYLWNSGCFAWRLDTLLDLVQQHMPELATLLGRLAPALDAGGPALDEALDRLYPDAPNVSVDYGIMEHATGVEGVALDARWNDVGSWSALYDVLPGDDEGNLVVGGDALLVDCRDTLAWGEDHLVAAVGVSDLVIVQAKGAVMVCRRHDAQRVKELVQALEKAGRGDFL